MEANDDGSLYGAVQQKSISDEILSLLDIKVSPDTVLLNPIKQLGETEVKIALYEEINASLILEVVKKT